MATVWRPIYTAPDGTKKRSRVWRIAYRDEVGELGKEDIAEYFWTLPSLFPAGYNEPHANEREEARIDDLPNVGESRSRRTSGEKTQKRKKDVNS